MSLEELAKRILKDGPRRVVVNVKGLATSPRKAWEVYGVKPDIVFIRNDGWSLAAPNYLAPTAFNLWPDEWLGFVHYSESNEPKPIWEYTPE